MKNFKRITAAVLSIMIIFMVWGTDVFAAQAQIQQQETGFSDDYLDSVRKLIKQKYSGSITDAALNKPTVEGMFEALDIYSVFYKQSEFNSFMDSLGGEIEGVGIVVEKIGDYVTVVKVFEGLPAQKAGIQKGDKISEVNGISAAKKEIDEVISNIKGTAGTKVKLGILKESIKDEVEVARARVDVPSVSYEIRGNIGYILIDMFSANTYSGVKEALNEFDSKSIANIVLDLRNNPGGLLDQAVSVGRLFVPKGLITKLDFKDEAMEDEEYYSSLKSIKYKLAVLVNENSASASEILTGAIKDTGAGVIIGNKTFGKAKVQSFIPILSPEAYERLNKDSENKTVNASMFEDAYESDLLGWAKMTMGMYYTPNGECIDLKGIEPDINVSEGSKEAGGIKVNEIRQLYIAVKPSLGTACSDVYNAECILKLLNYDVDEPDNILDKKTTEALTRFQKDNKVYGYGVLDFCTQRLLNDKLEALSESEDTVYLKAVDVLE
ncbi:carboxyl-terminal processing protease [Ruminiclostridium sufflavum DSM 19573]|uniref:Carboxyl-terminal processing protease n=1 Tax=Ruminiclostridium sufflavum DSM 19573 TaxID=1121337 RepID=A0A318XT15_9FIRM|nr:S41 family peptidase [Ruminiclostridium sufflavum]PYG89501.1 carboxyl-terminal processing protease [Ruminiclostridium sufflavum DSM 19573]